MKPVSLSFDLNKKEDLIFPKERVKVHDIGLQVELNSTVKAGTGEQPNKDESESSENIDLDSEGCHPDQEVYKEQFEIGAYIITI